MGVVMDLKVANRGYRRILNEVSKIMNASAYTYAAESAVLAALGITIEVYDGEKQGDVIVAISGAPPEIDREVVINVLNRTVKPLTDNLIVKYD
jgi:hypothetical protein